jgi:hypothetical protein
MGYPQSQIAEFIADTQALRPCAPRGKRKNSRREVDGWFSIRE